MSRSMFYGSNCYLHAMDQIEYAIYSKVIVLNDMIMEVMRMYVKSIRAAGGVNKITPRTM